MTLADIQKAARTGEAPNKRRELLRIPSRQNRLAIYTEAAHAIANKEQECMALYGGRPWTVTARVTEPKNQKTPLFRWFRGQLELATLPHLLEKIPDPPLLKGKQEYVKDDEYIPSTSLEERVVSSLSTVAWEDREYAIPNVTIKWLSPDHVFFYSRKSAWEHQEKLAEQQLFIQRIIHGLGFRGQKLKPFKPTRADAMKAGKWRFLRDGLWVVGQEEAWQAERAEWYEEELERKAGVQAAMGSKVEAVESAKNSSDEDSKPASKRPLSGLQCFLREKRHKYREEKNVERKRGAQGDSLEPSREMTLREAETELRDVWKTLTSEDKNEWKERAKKEQELRQTRDESKEDAMRETQKECAVTPTTDSDEPIVASHENIGLQKSQAVSNAGASSEQTAPSGRSAESLAPVSPSLPTAPKSEDDTQTSEAAPVSGSKLIPESDKIAFSAVPKKECATENEENHQTTSGELKPDSQVLPESAATCNESLTEAESQEGISAPTTWDEAHESSESAEKVEFSYSTSKTTPEPTLNDKTSKKRRKAALCPPKKFTLSSQFRMTPEQIALCHVAVTDHFETVMNTVKARALHSELQDGFDLLRERGRGRYDMELPVFDNPEFDFLTDLQSAAWMPIVRAVLGDDVVLIHKGAFLSMPGAEAQEYHQDGPHLSKQTQRPCHAVNVFIPLVELHSRNGPTEFCLGTHVLGHEGYVKDRVFTPHVPSGTPVMFDYRLGHRGLANSSSACRPIVYCTYAAAANGKEFRDSVNFSRKRYHKIGELVEKPLSREERAAKRRKRGSNAEMEQIAQAEREELESETPAPFQPASESLPEATSPFQPSAPIPESNPEVTTRSQLTDLESECEGTAPIEPMVPASVCESQASASIQRPASESMNPLGKYEGDEKHIRLECLQQVQPGLPHGVTYTGVAPSGPGMPLHGYTRSLALMAYARGLYLDQHDPYGGHYQQGCAHDQYGGYYQQGRAHDHQGCPPFRDP